MKTKSKNKIKAKASILLKEKSFLQANPIFKSFNPEVVDTFISKCRKKTFKKTDVICTEFSRSEKIYFILSGEASVEFALDNSDTRLIISPGDFICLDRFIQDKNPIATATITAKTDLSLLQWDSSDWKIIAASDKSVGYALSQAVAKTLLKRIKIWQVHLLNNASWGIE